MTPTREFALLRDLQRTLRLVEVMHGSGCHGSHRLRLFVLRRMTVLALVLFGTAASAHEWYPAWCCSGGDCGPLAASRVSPTAGGYLVDGKFMVPMSEVRRSMDGRFHGCFPTADSLKCFFAPPPGS